MLQQVRCHPHRPMQTLPLYMSPPTMWQEAIASSAPKMPGVHNADIDSQQLKLQKLAPNQRTLQDWRQAQQKADQPDMRWTYDGIAAGTSLLNSASAIAMARIANDFQNGAPFDLNATQQDLLLAALASNNQNQTSYESSAPQLVSQSKLGHSSLLSPYRSDENVQRALQAAQYVRSESASNTATTSRSDSPFRKSSPYRQPSNTTPFDVDYAVIDSVPNGRLLLPASILEVRRDTVGSPPFNVNVQDDVSIALPLHRFFCISHYAATDKAYSLTALTSLATTLTRLKTSTFISFGTRIPIVYSIVDSVSDW
jgi:hypothetical protein